MARQKFNPNTLKARALTLYDEGYTTKSFVINLLAEEFKSSDRTIYKYMGLFAQDDTGFATKFGYKTKTEEEPPSTPPAPPNHKSNTFTTPSIIESNLEGMNVVLDSFRRLYEPQKSDVEALEEQYLIIKDRGHDPIEWLTRTIHEIAKKNKDKHSIPYLIGMIRHKLNKGWGVLRSDDEDAIISEIECIIGAKLDIGHRQIVYRIMGKYGGVRVSLNLGKVDMVRAFLLELENHLGTLDIKHRQTYNGAS